MKKLIICSLFAVVFIFESSFSQDTTKTEKKIIPAPQRIETKQEEKQEPEKTLPIIDMKEYIITGKEEIKLEPGEKKLEENPAAVKSKEEKIKDVPEPKIKRPFEGAGDKYTKTINIPLFEEGNLFYLTYGKYNEFNIGTQFQKDYDKDDILINGDFRRTSGFRENADMYFGDLNFNDFHRFTEGITGNFNLNYSQGMHKFYGAQHPDFTDVERIVKFFSGRYQTNFRGWASWDIGIEAGARAGKVDDFREVSEKGLNGRFLIKKIAGNSIIKGEVYYDGEFLNRNEQNDKIDLFRANFEIESNIKKIFRLKIGTNVFNVNNITDGLENKFSKFYPYASLSRSIPGLGEIYGEYFPDVSVINLISALNKNRYIDAYSMFSYIDTPLSLKVGWKNRKLTNFNWEVYYLFQKLENFGIELEQLGPPPGYYSDSSPISRGFWDLDYEFKTQLQGLGFSMNWQQSDVLRLWASASVMDYSDLEFDPPGQMSSILGNVPYHPNVSADFTLDISPGGGVKFDLTGEYIGSRYISIESDDKLDPYFLVDMTIGKRFSKKIAFSAKIFNLFNQKYEIRRGYDQPDMVSAGNISYYW